MGLLLLISLNYHLRRLIILVSEVPKSKGGKFEVCRLKTVHLMNSAGKLSLQIDVFSAINSGQEG